MAFPFKPISKALQKFRVFDTRRQRYKRIFLTQDGKQVIAHLKTECFGHGTPFHKDPLEMARRCGRQEVFQIIIQMINYTEDDIAKLKEQLNG